jgi:hypothetical protein
MRRAATLPSKKGTAPRYDPRRTANGRRACSLPLPTQSNRKAAPAAPSAPAVFQTERGPEESWRIPAGQATAKALSGAGGAPSELSVEALANMSEDEFAAIYASKGKQIEAMLGRARR